jgi:hypothetical protein
MVDVEAAGMVTGGGGFLVTATQYFVPANVNYTGSLPMGFLTMVAGLGGVVAHSQRQAETGER